MNDKLIKTIGEIGLQRLDECSKFARTRFLPSVRVCFGVGERDEPLPFGTCFLMRVGGYPFLITAAHVIDKNVHFSIYIQGGSKPVLLKAEFIATKRPGNDRNADHYDFAFTELSDAQCADLEAGSMIDESDISANQARTDNRAYMTLGYPATKQERVWQKPIVLITPWTFVGTDKPDEAFSKKLGVSGSDHFFIVHNKYVSNFAGEKLTAVKPQGASGGMLIDLGPFDPDKLRPDAPCVGLLAGVLIEHNTHAKRIVAVKIQLVLEKIKEYLKRD